MISCYLTKTQVMAHFSLLLQEHMQLLAQTHFGISVSTIVVVLVCLSLNIIVYIFVDSHHKLYNKMENHHSWLY